MKVNHRKHGARMFGLLVVAVLGVMAFAVSAQAAVPGFLIGGKAFSSLTLVEGEQEGSGTMLVPGLNFQLSCTTMTTEKGAIESKTDGIAVLLYTGCTTLSIPKFPEEINCDVKEPIKAEALLLPTEITTTNAPAVLAEKVKALITLHEPGPKGELTLTPCVLPLDNTVIGEVCFEIKAGTNDTVRPLLYTDANASCKVKTELEKGTEGSGTFKDVLKYGAQTVTLDGKVELFVPGGGSVTLGVSLY